MGGHRQVDGTSARLSFGHQSAVPIEDWCVGLRDELDVVAADAAAPLNAAFAQAVRISLSTPEMMASLRVLYGASRDGTGPEASRTHTPAQHMITGPEATRRIRTSAQRLLLSRPGRSYPYDYPDHDAMLEGLRWIHDDPDRAGQFRRGLQEDLHTAVSQRYVAELVAGMALRRGPKLIRLDIGCSNNSGNVRLLSGYGFDKLQVLGAPVEGKGRAADPEGTRLLNDQLALHASSLVVPQVVGIDRVDMAGAGHSGAVDPAWYTPDEIADGAMLRLHRELAELAKAKLSTDQLKFLIANVADAEDVARLLDVLNLKDRRFDVVSAIASLYQNSPGQLKRIRDNVTHRLLDRNGYAYILDFLDVRYDEKGHPYIGRPSTWSQMNLLVYGKAAGEPHRTLRRIAWFRGGRARTIAFTSAFARLARGGPFEELARQLSPSPTKQ